MKYSIDKNYGLKHQNKKIKTLLFLFVLAISSSSLKAQDTIGLLYFDSVMISMESGSSIYVKFNYATDNAESLITQYDPTFDKNAGFFEIKIKEDGTIAKFMFNEANSYNVYWTVTSRFAHVKIDTTFEFPYTQNGGWPFDTTLVLEKGDVVKTWGNKLGSSGKSYFFGMKIDKITGIENLSEHGQNLKLFPNPASNYLHIEFEGFTPTYYRIIDAKGQLIKDAKFSNRIYVGDLTKGIYFLQLEIEGELIVKKFNIE